MFMGTLPILKSIRICSRFYPEGSRQGMISRTRTLRAEMVGTTNRRQQAEITRLTQENGQRQSRIEELGGEVRRLTAENGEHQTRIGQLEGQLVLARQDREQRSLNSWGSTEWHKTQIVSSERIEQLQGELKNAQKFKGKLKTEARTRKN